MAAAYTQSTQCTCVGCGKVGMASPSVAAKRKYCTMQCRLAHQKAHILCQVCGRERPVTPTQIKHGSRFCSWECARQALNAPRPIVTCQQCGKECHVPPSRVRQGMRFCSHSCRSIHTVLRMPTTETTIELILYRTLEALGVFFLRQHPLVEAHTIPDAYVPEGKVALYADGDYWHALPKVSARDKRQSERLKELGHVVIRLSESDLRHDAMNLIRQALNL